MIEFLAEAIGEFLLQAVGEILFEVGIRALGEPFRRAPTPLLAAFGYFFFGTILGLLSLLIFPNHLVPGRDLRLINLILTPVAVGLVMTGVGFLRERRGEPVLRIDRFGYGYLFAFAIAAVRFGLAD